MDHEQQALAPVAAEPGQPKDTRKLCTCDGAGRGPGRACVVKAGGRLGELWRCADGLEPAPVAQPVACVECGGPLQWRCPACRIAQSRAVAQPVARAKE